MLNSNQWLHQHDEFVSQSQALLQRSQECVAHLQMIADDEDALACLQTTLLTLTDKAADASQNNIAGFTAQLREGLRRRLNDNRLNVETIDTLGRCLDLLAWQLELIDPHTGELALDDEEQHALLNTLGL
ncbi:hypothetical protein PS3A_22140 [Pseudomonas sp. 3A(2025)]